jgi:hypothetical protein
MLDKAVLNNILWCGTVSEMHGASRKMSGNIWGLSSGAPRFYPDIITSSKDVLTQEVIDFIGKREIFSLKDSYSNLELVPYGFKILFEAEWIYHEPIHGESKGQEWRIIQTEKELLEWASICDLQDIMKRDIIKKSDVKIFINWEKQTSFIANLGADVVGISNVFSKVPPNEELWVNISQIVSTKFPGLPMVGYEHGQDLLYALSSGWKSLGPLRVWIKNNS